MNELSSEAMALWALVIAVIGFATLNFFTSPKENHNNSNARLSALESAHQTLALRFEGSFTKHDEGMKHLTEAVDDLTTEMKELKIAVGKLASARRR